MNAVQAVRLAMANLVLVPGENNNNSWEKDEGKWYLVDATNADTEVGYPGDLVSEHNSRTEAMDARAAKVIEAFKSVDEDFRSIRIAARGGNAINDNAYMFDWMANRLVTVYGENPNTDYILAAHERARRLREDGLCDSKPEIATEPSYSPKKIIEELLELAKDSGLKITFPESAEPWVKP